MAHKFKVGDHVSWNSQVGQVSGTVKAVHTKQTSFKGRLRRATAEQPQYEIASDTSDHLAMHKETLLRKK